MNHHRQRAARKRAAEVHTLKREVSYIRARYARGHSAVRIINDIKLRESLPNILRALEYIGITVKLRVHVGYIELIYTGLVP